MTPHGAFTKTCPRLYLRLNKLHFQAILMFTLFHMKEHHHTKHTSFNLLAPEFYI